MAVPAWVGAHETRANIRKIWHAPQQRELAAPPSRELQSGASLHQWFSPLEQRLLGTFDRVSPELLAKRDLLQRTDTKYVMPRQLFPQLLANLDVHYRILLAGDSPAALYLTEYFDTPSYDLFHDHRRGKRLRFKVRVRHYLDRAMSYLEVKGKCAESGTTKRRRPLRFLSEELSPEDVRFISDNTTLDGFALVPVMVNQFRRVTLIGLEFPERITFDMDMQFENDAGVHKLPKVLVAEVKQAQLTRQSPMLRALSLHGIRPASASKYCIGTMLLNPTLRQNRLRPALLGFERACQC
jgi:hypothetical protein